METAMLDRAARIEQAAREVLEFYRPPHWGLGQHGAHAARESLREALAMPATPSAPAEPECRDCGGTGVLHGDRRTRNCDCRYAPSQPASEAGETIVIPEMAVVVTQLVPDEPAGEHKPAFNTAADSGHAKGSVAQGAEAVIRGPGKYIERRGNRCSVVVQDEGNHNGAWLGWDSAGRPAAWNFAGQRVDRTGDVEGEMTAWFITGPYVEPPKPPATLGEIGKRLSDESQLLRRWIHSLSAGRSFSDNAAKHLHDLATRLDELVAKVSAEAGK